MLMIAIKIVVTSAMVLGLSWLSERVGPKAAGVFAGFPLGIAVSLFFLGVEQGPQFAAVSTIGGLGASLIFCFAYWKFSSSLKKWNVALTTVFSLIVFLLAAGAQLPQNWWVLTALTLVLTGLAIVVFRGINRHSPDDIQIRGNRTTAPSPRELCSHCSHPMT